jgi:hypothetical protein
MKAAYPAARVLSLQDVLPAVQSADGLRLQEEDMQSLEGLVKAWLRHCASTASVRGGPALDEALAKVGVDLLRG